MALSEAGGLTLTIIKPIDKAEDDQLAHKFCLLCKRADEIRGVKAKPYCGKQKVGEWESASDDDIVCVVCSHMVMSPCPRCGEQRF